MNIADDKIEDEEYASRFLSTGLLDWQAEAAKAEKLIDAFETAMSPQVYLDREPLCRSSHRENLIKEDVNNDPIRHDNRS